MQKPLRFAIVKSSHPTERLAAKVEAYLPAGYSVLACEDEEQEPGAELRQGEVLIGGRDEAGWTMDDYVLPRLASGLYIGREVTLIQKRWGDG